MDKSDEKKKPGKAKMPYSAQLQAELEALSAILRAQESEAANQDGRKDAGKASPTDE